MKKSLFILLLCALQAACGSQPTVAQEAAALLTFEQLGGEISVSYEVLEEGQEEPQRVALTR